MVAKTTIYIVENNELVEYNRLGQCNRCGECCGIHNTIKFSMKVSFVDSLPEEGEEQVCSKEPADWSNWEGWSIIYGQGTWFWFKISSIDDTPHPCPSQDELSACTIWKDEDDFRPICRYWPFHPDNLIKFPNCGFSFERCEGE